MSTTESNSRYDNLEKMSIGEILRNINREDQTVAQAVEKVLPQIEKLVSEIVPRMKKGGRLFYIGAGTSGRLGILDASEIPPTFGVDSGFVIGIIAGGDKAIRQAVEFAEDDPHQAWKDLSVYEIDQDDAVVGIASSGTTPYVVAGIKDCRQHGIFTGAVTCNENTPLAAAADAAVECVVGPEFITGSTRMKSGTAQKMILNMISTAVMIQLGRVKGNKMVDMQLSNDKLRRRGIKMLVEELQVSAEEAESLLSAHGNVRQAIEWYRKNA